MKNAPMHARMHTVGAGVGDGDGDGVGLGDGLGVGDSVNRYTLTSHSASGLVSAFATVTADPDWPLHCTVCTVVAELSVPQT